MCWRVHSGGTHRNDGCVLEGVPDRHAVLWSRERLRIHRQWWPAVTRPREQAHKTFPYSSTGSSAALLTQRLEVRLFLGEPEQDKPRSESPQVMPAHPRAEGNPRTMPS